MTLETYNLQFHLVKAENSQDIQNRYLLYNQAQNAALSEEEKLKAILARQRVQEATEPEGKIVDPDDQSGHPGSSSRKKRQRRDEADQSEDQRKGSAGGGQLIDVII